MSLHGNVKTNCMYRCWKGNKNRKNKPFPSPPLISRSWKFSLIYLCWPQNLAAILIGSTSDQSPTFPLLFCYWNLLTARRNLKTTVYPVGWESFNRNLLLSFFKTSSGCKSFLTCTGRKKLTYFSQLSNNISDQRWAFMFILLPFGCFGKIYSPFLYI